MKYKTRFFLILGTGIMLSGCRGVPVAVTYAGHSLVGLGEPSPDMSEFSFVVSDQQVSCGGKYNLSEAFAVNFSFKLSCSDGRTGRVVAERSAMAKDKDMLDYPAIGKIIFSGGSIGMFNIGMSAGSININSLEYKDFMENMHGSELH